MTTAPDIHSLAGAFALDALDPLERKAFTGHVATCEACRHEVAELRETAARLADDTWATPPARMREAVMARIRVTRQEAPGRADGRGGAHERSRAPRPRVQAWRHRTGILVAASLLAVAGFAGYMGVQAREADIERGRIEAVLAAPDAALRTAQLQGGGRMTVVTSQARDAAVVVMADAAPPGDDRAYQLWLIRGNAPQSAGVLASGQTGATRYLTGVAGVDSLGVTNEPAAGSALPTTDILGQVSLRNA